jgi:hypothetical protein
MNFSFIWILNFSSIVLILGGYIRTFNWIPGRYKAIKKPQIEKEIEKIEIEIEKGITKHLHLPPPPVILSFPPSNKRKIDKATD